MDVGCDLRPIVDYAGAEQDSPRRPFTALCTSNKTLFGPLQSLNQTFGHDRPKFGSLISHQRKKFGASYPTWVPGMIVRTRDQGSSAMPGIDNCDREVKSCEIDGCRQACGSCADDKAVERLFHRVRKRRCGMPVPCSSRQSHRNSRLWQGLQIQTAAKEEMHHGR